MSAKSNSKVEKLIKEAEQHGNEELSLSTLGISELRPIVSTTLTSLNLSFNKFTEIPKSLSQLPSLEILDLSANQITSIPSELGKLTNLR